MLAKQVLYHIDPSPMVAMVGSHDNRRQNKPHVACRGCVLPSFRSLSCLRMALADENR